MIEFKASLRGGGAKATAVHNTRSLSIRTDKAVVNGTVAERLLNARELNGYSQTKAAELLGYKTPAQLNQWEMSRRPVPLRMLIRACHVYRVSMDYLVGISDEPDRDPSSAIRRQVVAASEQMLANMAEDLAEALMHQAKMGGPAIEAALLIVEGGEKLVNAFKRFAELNAKQFEDMRGGATLIASAESFEANSLSAARAAVERFMRANKDSAETVLVQNKTNSGKKLVSMKSLIERLSTPSSNDDLFAHGDA